MHSKKSLELQKIAIFGTEITIFLHVSGHNELPTNQTSDDEFECKQTAENFKIITSNNQTVIRETAKDFYLKLRKSRERTKRLYVHEGLNLEQEDHEEIFKENNSNVAVEKRKYSSGQASEKLYQKLRKLSKSLTYDEDDYDNDDFI